VVVGPSERFRQSWSRYADLVGGLNHDDLHDYRCIESVARGTYKVLSALTMVLLRSFHVLKLLARPVLRYTDHME
jgi:hypothetical protein